MGNYARVNGLKLYYEARGTGRPLILLHGSFGSTGMFAEILPKLAEGRRVIAADLQAHGRTADIDRPLGVEGLADDVAALIRHLGLGRADVMGYSMGGGVALQTAVRHPGVVRKLVVVSFPFRRDGWYPEVLAGLNGVGREAAEPMRQSPMYEAYAAVAPRPEDWPVLWEKAGEAVRQDYDWTEEVASIRSPTMVVAGDADGFPPAHAAEFFGLLGGGQRDPGWDGSGTPASRLAVLPGTTHYDSFASPLLAPAVTPFLDEPAPGDDQPSESDLPDGLGKPATRALAEAGYERLEQFTAVSEAEVLRLHGVGPKALRVLRGALAARGLGFGGS
jgi:pimeloyl-ACP methyl ester carboxylesterase